MSRARHLVLQHIENVSRKVLQEHQEVIRDYVAGKSGIYALYRRNKLYYVGLASGRSHAMTRRPASGWYWWKYRKQSGEWVRMKELLR